MSRAGFSLIELLVVVAVLATVAGGVVVSLSGVETHAATELTVRELAELKQAVLRFREDTGFLPKQGPFALEPAGQVPEPSAGVAWFASPANLSQLIENPLADTGHPLETWDPDTRRGWRGPYLSRALEARVVVCDGLALDGSAGSPAEGTLLPPMPALADPFPAPPLSNGAYAWSTHDAAALPRGGRPFLLLQLDDPTRARVVALGADGEFAPSPDRLVGLDSDDVGLYLLR